MHYQIGELGYLADDPLYLQEKPYVCDFSTEEIEGAQPTNHLFDEQSVSINHLTPLSDATLQNSGFQLVHSEWPQFSSADMQSTSFLHKRYFPIVSDLLIKLYGYRTVVFVDGKIRKRHHSFPENSNIRVPDPQPLTLAHTDFTDLGARDLYEKLDNSHDGEGVRELKGRAYDQLNVWRVIKGPNNDWPLALCDHRSIDQGKDPIRNDLVYHDSILENLLLRRNKNHQWFYVPNQQPSDVLVFRNASSIGRDAPCSFHAAFKPVGAGTEEVAPRESIEIRVFAFL